MLTPDEERLYQELTALLSNKMGWKAGPLLYEWAALGKKRMENETGETSEAPDGGESEEEK